MALRVGETLGAYEITGTLGSGGMGEVYRARDSRVKRDVALKTSNTAFTDRFQREAEAIAALSHPNVCTLFDVGPDYLVMELVEGPTLADVLAKGRLPVPEALRIASHRGLTTVAITTDRPNLLAALASHAVRVPAAGTFQPEFVATALRYLVQTAGGALDARRRRTAQPLGPIEFS